MYCAKLRSLLNMHVESRKVEDFMSLLICDRVKSVLSEGCLRHVFTRPVLVIIVRLPVCVSHCLSHHVPLLDHVYQAYFANCLNMLINTVQCSPLLCN